jgi:ATP-binding cassette, subfamily A (ABC1), member 2
MAKSSNSFAELASMQSEGAARDVVVDGPKIRRHNFFQTLTFQVNLLLWKRFVELKKQPLEIAKIVAPPLFFLLLIILLYAVFSPDSQTGALEVLMVPMAFWLFAQMIVVHVMYEKKHRLQEAMKMMGLLDASYWIAYFIFDAILIGFGIALLSMIMASTYGLFNGADLGSVFGLVWVYLLALAPFGFFMCSVFDNPQTAGQVTLAVMLGFYVMYIALVLQQKSDSFQGFCCLFPPLAFQLGVNSFKSNYHGIGLNQICGMLLLDTGMYSVLAWYFAQIWPSEVGVRKPFWFPLDPNYWTGVESRDGRSAASSNTSPLVENEIESQASKAKQFPMEKANESVLGKPSVSINKLKKTWDSGQVAVNELSFDMYANQIFCLLGHNGAGKTTVINMLTGLMPPDYFSDGGATIYGYDVHDEMDLIRHTMGVCPQHDVLFEHMSVKEHIMLFSQLKGYSEAEAAAEVEGLAAQFHLDKRLDHTGSELSGGQKRKLSVAIAICGGSKFVVLDEPTAGLDPLARRELWDLMASLRHGRTILMTTHVSDTYLMCLLAMSLLAHAPFWCLCM